MTPAWMLDAKCRGIPVATFFPEKHEPTGHIRELCATCPVRVECAETAIADSSIKGWWGGLPEPARARERTRRGLKRRPPTRHATCGTDGGYQAHMRRNEDACEGCREAHRIAHQARRNRRRQSGSAA